MGDEPSATLEVGVAFDKIEDAIRVLHDQNTHQAQQDTLQSILNQVRTANASALWSTRRSVIATAIAGLNSVRPLFGSNFDYPLGAGTLMYQRSQSTRAGVARELSIPSSFSPNRAPQRARGLTESLAGASRV